MCERVLYECGSMRGVHINDLTGGVDSPNCQVCAESLRFIFMFCRAYDTINVQEINELSESSQIVQSHIVSVRQVPKSFTIKLQLSTNDTYDVVDQESQHKNSKP